MVGGITYDANWQDVVETLANRGFIAKVFGQYCTCWTYRDRLVGDREFSIHGLTARRIEYDPGSMPPSAQGEYGFLVFITADPDTQAAQNAAIEVEDKVRV